MGIAAEGGGGGVNPGWFLEEVTIGHSSRGGVGPGIVPGGGEYSYGSSGGESMMNKWEISMLKISTRFRLHT